MKVHLKEYPCTNGVSPKNEPYTVNKSDVTCKACLKPVAVKKEVEQAPKRVTKPNPKK